MSPQQQAQAGETGQAARSARLAECRRLWIAHCTGMLLCSTCAKGAPKRRPEVCAERRHVRHAPRLERRCACADAAVLPSHQVLAARVTDILNCRLPHESAGQPAQGVQRGGWMQPHMLPMRQQTPEASQQGGRAAARHGYPRHSSCCMVLKNLPPLPAVAAGLRPSSPSSQPTHAQSAALSSEGASLVELRTDTSESPLAGNSVLEHAPRVITRPASDASAKNLQVWAQRVRRLLLGPAPADASACSGAARGHYGNPRRQHARRCFARRLAGPSLQVGAHSLKHHHAAAAAHVGAALAGWGVRQVSRESLHGRDRAHWLRWARKGHERVCLPAMGALSGATGRVRTVVSRVALL